MNSDLNTFLQARSGARARAGAGAGAGKGLRLTPSVCCSVFKVKAVLQRFYNSCARYRGGSR